MIVKLLVESGTTLSRIVMNFNEMTNSSVVWNKIEGYVHVMQVNV